MSIFAAARRKCRKRGMPQPRKHSSALAAVIQRVFFESLRQRVAGRDRYRRNSKIRPKPFAVPRESLLPLRRGVISLVDAANHSGARDGIRPKRVEKVIPEFRFLRGLDI